MRRLFKIFTGAIIWLCIGIYIILIILLQTPSVQRYIGSEAESLLSEHLGTKVEIGKVSLGFLNRIIVDNAIIYDKQDIDMFKARRLSVKINIPSLLSGKVSISSAQVFAAHLNLYQDSIGSQHNFQFVLDALASKDSTGSSSLDLRINSLIMRQCSVAYNKNYVDETPNVINPSHLHVKDISAHIILKALRKDSVNLNIKRLAFNEQSGLNVKRMSMAFKAGMQGCVLSDLRFRLPQSYFSIDSVVADYNATATALDYSTLKYYGIVNKSVLYTSDFTFLSSIFTNTNDSITLFSDFKGSASEIQVNNIHAELPGTLLTKLLGKSSVATDNLGLVSVDASCNLDTLGNGTFDMALASDAGGFLVNANMEEKSNVTGRILTDSIRMNRLFPQAGLGVFKLQSSFTAKLDSAMNVCEAGLKGSIPAVDYKNYRYKTVDFNGSYNGKTFVSNISIDNTNASVSLKGSLAKVGKILDADVSAEVRHIMPQATNLSQKWGDAVLSGNLSATLRGSRLEDLNGRVNISDLNLESPERSYNLESCILDLRSDNGEQTITMNSDFGHMRINGNFNYASLPNSIVNMIRKKLPGIPGLPEKTIRTDNRIQLYCILDRTDWMEVLLGIPFQLNKRTTLVAKIDDRTGEMYANCLLPQFYYNNSEYRNAIVALTSPDDTLNCNIAISKINKEGIPLDIRMSNKAFENKLSANLSFDNNANKHIKGNVEATALFSSNDNNPTAHISIHPSQLSLNDDLWQIAPSKVVYSEKNISVDKFVVSHNRESITISGNASESPDDQLTVSLRNIDVDYILNLVNFRSVKFGGKASGRAVLQAPFGDMTARAKLMVNNFKFLDGRMGVLDANVNWNNTDKLINIDAIADDGPDAMTFINGYVSPSPGFIDLKIRAAGTHLDFMESFTSSFTNNVTGHVHGNVNLVGPLKAINLVGDLVVNGSMNITPLNTKYYLRNDSIKIIPNEIQILPSEVNDIYGNKATLKGFIRHKNLTKLTYDLFVGTDNLLVYDFKDFGKEVFCGTVYGAGNVEIHGKSKELRMAVDMTTRPNSTFTYNVSTPDAIIDQKFITWNTKYSDNAGSSIGDKVIDMPNNISGTTLIDFKINCTSDAMVNFLMDSKTGDRISLYGGGLLNAHYHNKKGFEMYGTYTVDRGTYSMTIQDIIKKNFTFKEGGTLKFGGEPSQAKLNLQAVHTVNSVSLSELNVGDSYSDNTTRVNCLLNITGEPFALQLDYGIELPTASSEQERNIRSVIHGEDGMKQQVIYLLGFGRFMPQMNNNETYQDPNKLSQTTQAMQGLLSGTISTQINNILNSAINNNNWNFGANISTGDEGWHNAEYEGLLNGRLLNNRLIINGQFGYRDNVTTANSSFIGDFDISYLLVPNGNLALKVYNQTNDKYFTKSSLNTQGIGFIIKKDFINLHDLFGIKKKKKRQK